MFHSSRRALYQPDPRSWFVPDLVVMRISPLACRPFSAVYPLVMTFTSPTASMFGVMCVVPSPPSSPTGTPSIVVFLFSEFPPLMLRPRPEFHCAKSRLAVVSTMPGRIFIMPKMSRPLTWIAVS